MGPGTKGARVRTDTKPADPPALPDYYETVARDLLAFCGPPAGEVWVDLGSGAGGVGLALLAGSAGATLVLVDPDAAALRRGLAAASERGLGGRVVAVAAPAERLPLPDESVDVVVSRGSIYFWRDPAQGLREVWRVLRPGGRAMIGGGLGREYPPWARREFIRRRRASVAAKGPGALRAFAEARSPATFRRLARDAGLPHFEVVGHGGLDHEHPDAGIGVWLRLRKERDDGR